MAQFVPALAATGATSAVWVTAVSCVRMEGIVSVTQESVKQLQVDMVRVKEDLACVKQQLAAQGGQLAAQGGQLARILDLLSKRKR